jgi:diaminopropionate ammonia-lyase
MQLLVNPWRSSGLPGFAEADLSIDPARARALLAHCPAAGVTPLIDSSGIATALGVEHVWIKDERNRMGLGSFKALGAAYVIALDAEKRLGGDWDRPSEELAHTLSDVTYVTASAGNHGLSVAAGARVFGAKAVIFISHNVSEGFAARLERFGATVTRAGFDYEESLAASRDVATTEGWVLLTDSSWPGYTDIPRLVMEGYLVMGAEAADQVEAIAAPPTHVVLHAGVGGFAASIAAYARHRWGDEPLIVVVEAERAPCLMESIRVGRAVRADGPLGSLARDADYFLTISDEEATETVRFLGDHDIETTPSGAAGVSGIHSVGDRRQEMSLDESSRVLAFLSEGPEPT